LIWPQAMHNKVVTAVAPPIKNGIGQVRSLAVRCKLG
jgi:hypothetical protein